MENINGIKYENGLPAATNGSWVQTVAYLLDYIRVNQIELTNELINNITEALYNNISGGTITIVKTSNLPQDTHIELYNPHPDIVPAPKIEQRNIINKPAARVVHKPVMEIYKKCCGSNVLLSSKQQKKYNECMKRVDFCYAKIKEANGIVTTNDMNMMKVKLPDCGLSYNPASRGTDPKNRDGC